MNVYYQRGLGIGLVCRETARPMCRRKGSPGAASDGCAGCPCGPGGSPSHSGVAFSLHELLRLYQHLGQAVVVARLAPVMPISTEAHSRRSWRQLMTLEFVQVRSRWMQSALGLGLGRSRSRAGGMWPSEKRTILQHPLGPVVGARSPGSAHGVRPTGPFAGDTRPTAAVGSGPSGR
jgi:hypothetical protein